MPPHLAAATRTERAVDSGISLAARLGRLSPQSWLAIFILFGMAIWAATLWWVANTFTAKLDQNTQALVRFGAAVERLAGARSFAE